MSDEISISDRIKIISDLAIEMDATIIAQAMEIDRLRDALKRIDEEDDTGPTIFEERGDGPWQAIGGSKGRFSPIARAALRRLP